MKKIFFIAAGLSIMISQTGCFGSFELTKKVWEFNDNTFDNKVVKTLMFYVLNIVPIYGIAGFLDVVIFNLIEFWSGSNPVAMKEGQFEEQFTKIDGVDFKITATKNKMSFQKIDGNNLIDMGQMVYSEEKTSWSFIQDDVALELVKINFNSNTANYYTANKTETVDLSSLDCITLNMKNSSALYANN